MLEFPLYVREKDEDVIIGLNLSMEIPREKLRVRNPTTTVTGGLRRRLTQT